jgi:3-oxoisoapionate decarboxylase
MTRRTLLYAGACAAVTGAAPPRSKMGVATTSYMTARKPRDTFEFLEHVAALGAGGIHAPLTSLEPAYLNKLRARAAQAGMYIEVMASLPKTNDTAAFARTVAAAKEVGAVALRSGALSGRRYETFNTRADWEAFVAESRAAVDRALPILERQRMPLGLENHKDWTLDEHVSLMKEKSSEWLGVCLDTGNNISLLDDPMELVEALAPYTICTHLKDMAVAPYEDGFLLSEMPLGEGMLDMKRVVAAIHKARPAARMTLEMITRDPLKVPCLTEKYWVTFPQRNGVYLARTLRMVHQQAHRQPLPMLTNLDHAAQLRLEEDNIKQCLNYAREQLGL